MIAWLPRWFALLLVLPFTILVALPPDKDIERLVKMLDSEKFKERLEATKRGRKGVRNRY